MKILANICPTFLPGMEVGQLIQVISVNRATGEVTLDSDFAYELYGLKTTTQPKLANPNLAPTDTCNHTMAQYTGLVETYSYCKNCGKKQSELENELQAMLNEYADKIEGKAIQYHHWSYSDKAYKTAFQRECDFEFGKAFDKIKIDMENEMSGTGAWLPDED